MKDRTVKLLNALVDDGKLTSWQEVPDGVYVMTPALRQMLHEAISDEGWGDDGGGYKGECHDAVDLWDDGPVVSHDEALSTKDLYAMFEDEDAPDPHLIGLISYFGLEEQATAS